MCLREEEVEEVAATSKAEKDAGAYKVTTPFLQKVSADKTEMMRAAAADADKRSSSDNPDTPWVISRFTHGKRKVGYLRPDGFWDFTEFYKAARYTETEALAFLERIGESNWTCASYSDVAIIQLMD